MNFIPFASLRRIEHSHLDVGTKSNSLKAQLGICDMFLLPCFLTPFYGEVAGTYLPFTVETREMVTLDFNFAGP
jgi:hypothetical protein